MLLVKTYIDKSPIHGIGLFAGEFIPKGKVFWELKKGFDVILTQEEYEILPILAKEYFDHFAYYDTKDGGWVLCGDNARFINHSEEPNYNDSPETGCAMIKDVNIGEEILGNYYSFNEKEPKNLYK